MDCMGGNDYHFVCEERTATAAESGGDAGPLIWKQPLHQASWQSTNENFCLAVSHCTAESRTSNL